MKPNNLPSSSAASVTVDAVPGIPDGAYALDSVIKTVGGKTFNFQRDQMKIFTNNRFMFAFFDDQTNEIDAAAGYAVWVGGVLTETPIANQDGPVEGLNFEIALETTKAGFTQIVRGMPADNGGTYDLDEVWETQSTEKSAFDGLWKLEKRDREESDCSNFQEMKLIGGGHYMFFQRFEDKGDRVKHFGFGSMQVDESGLVTETGMTSTLEDYSGRDQQLNTKLIDANHMTQSFMLDGIEVIQSYVRI
jgi:hypothetical protein